MPGSDQAKESTGVDFGRHNTFGDVSVSGTVAGRDVVPAAEVDPRDRQQLLETLDRLQAEVLKLAEAPAGDREDAHDELRKASEAARVGDNERLVKKLQGAQSILQTIGASLPAALALGQTVAVLAEKVIGLG